MEGIDKIKFAEKTLKNIQGIYKKGFNKASHPDIWRDLTKIMVRIDMLLEVLQQEI